MDWFTICFTPNGYDEVSQERTLRARFGQEMKLEP